ncbi:hypothetical protein CLOP_g25361, partial [Closterium sp. NIES-67]
LIDHLQGARYFPNIELCNGYHQIHFFSDNCHKTVFHTRHGSYEYTAMVFELTNAPLTLQLTINGGNDAVLVVVDRLTKMADLAYSSPAWSFACMVSLLQSSAIEFQFHLVILARHVEQIWHMPRVFFRLSPANRRPDRTNISVHGTIDSLTTRWRPRIQQR